MCCNQVHREDLLRWDCTSQSAPNTCHGLTRIGLAHIWGFIVNRRADKIKIRKKKKLPCKRRPISRTEKLTCAPRRYREGDTTYAHLTSSIEPHHQPQDAYRISKYAMAPLRGTRKRKEHDEADETSDLDFDGDTLDGVLSQSDSDSDAESTDFEDYDSDPDESQSDVQSDDADHKLEAEHATHATVDAGVESLEGAPSYRIVTDANGGERYEYEEIDPVYDSDDTDAQGPTNTIGNIPLSFYDSYPHIGYDINGKKIMRRATGEALDALLDSIELPKGWTGLTDPETGKPLNLSQDELELLRRLQMGEVPDEGHDPYPVSLFRSADFDLFNWLTTEAGYDSILH